MHLRPLLWLSYCIALWHIQCFGALLQQPIHDNPICCSFVPVNTVASRHKTGTAPCICCFHVMRRDNMPPRHFGCKCLFLHPKILLSQHLTPSLDSGSPAYQSSPFFWQLLTFPQPAAHPVFLLKGSYLCATVLTFTLFYVLHFGRCSPLILHTL